MLGLRNNKNQTPRTKLPNDIVRQELLGKGAEKKMRQKYGLLPNRGGGSPRVIKNQTPFLEKYFFSELVESF